MNEEVMAEAPSHVQYINEDGTVSVFPLGEATDPNRVVQGSEAVQPSEPTPA